MPTLCYLAFDGNAKDAISFYQSIFKGTPSTMMTYKDYPDPNYQPPESIKDLVMHAEIEVFGSRVMISDMPRGFGLDPVIGNNFSVAVISSDVKALQAAFEKIAEGGKIITAFDQSFFSEGYGYCFDKFGIGWQFIAE